MTLSRLCRTWLCALFDDTVEYQVLKGASHGKIFLLSTKETGRNHDILNSIIMAPRTFTENEWEELTAAFQILGLPDTPYARSFEQRRSIHGGDGLFARQKIKKGTRILVDEALFWVTNDAQITPRALRHPAFLQLHCPSVSPTQNHNQRRFAANCFEMGYHGRGNNQVVRQGIFLDAARFNHACVPNAHFAWDDDLAGPADGRLTVYAIVDIDRDEEISLNYGALEDFSKPWATRQAEYREVYDFTCNCRACFTSRPGRVGTDFANQSEERRARLRDLLERINRNRDPTTRALMDQQRSNIMAAWSCLFENLTIYPQQAMNRRELVDWYRRMLDQAQGVTDECLQQWRMEATGYARESLRLDITCTGYELPVVTQTLRLIEDLKR